jgi:fumarate reductase subunit C
VKDFLNNPVVQKLAMILVAAALYIGGTFFPGAENALHMLAASIAGGAMIKRPGDEKTSGN